MCVCVCVCVCVCLHRVWVSKSVICLITSLHAHSHVFLGFCLLFLVLCDYLTAWRKGPMSLGLAVRWIILGSSVCCNYALFLICLLRTLDST